MAVGLQLATKNSFVRVQEDINDNLTKLDEAIDFNLLATLGIEYGGILNNTNAKTSGKAYYDQTGKKLYKCIANTSINYADASYFKALSNNDLLGRTEKVHFSASNYTDINKAGAGYDLSKWINEGYNVFLLSIGWFGYCSTVVINYPDPVTAGITSRQTKIGETSPNADPTYCIKLSIDNNKKLIVKESSGYTGVVNVHGVIAYKA